METFKCPYCGKAHPDTTIFCVQKQKALVKYPTLLLVTLLLLALAAELVTAFTQPDRPNNGSNFLATVFIYKPWLLYSFLGILLLVWEGSFLRKRPVQRSIAWAVTIAALIIIGLFTAEPELLTALQNSQLLRDFFKNPWTYIIANLIFVLFWLYQTIRRRLRRDKSRRVQTIFSDDSGEEEESPAIAETEYTSGDLLAGGLIFLFSAFMFPFLYLIIARYALEAVPAAQSAGHPTPQLTWLFDNFDKMTSLRIGGDAPAHPDSPAGFSLALLDLAIATLLFAVSTISLLIVTYNEGLQEISAVTSEEQGLLPRHTSELPVIRASDLPRASSAKGSEEGAQEQMEESASESPGEVTIPNLTAIGSPEAEATEEDVELAVGKTVARTAIAGLTRALISLRVVAGSAALSLRSLLWPFSIFVGVAFVAAASGVFYDYLHSVDKFPRYSASGWASFTTILSTFINWLVSWLEICLFGLVALALVTIAIAVFTRARYVLSDAVNFLRWFGLLVVLTYWIFAIALLALNATMRLQEFVPIKGLENPWPLALDLTGILSFVLFCFLAIPPLVQDWRSQKPKNPKAA